MNSREGTSAGSSHPSNCKCIIVNPTAEGVTITYCEDPNAIVQENLDLYYNAILCNEVSIFSGDGLYICPYCDNARDKNQSKIGLKRHANGVVSSSRNSHSLASLGVHLGILKYLDEH